MPPGPHWIGAANAHFNVLFLDGVYEHRDNRPPRFQRVKAPDKGELEELVQPISQRVGRCLDRQGLLEKDTESAWCHRPERHLGQGELMRSMKRGCPGVRCRFALGSTFNRRFICPILSLPGG